MNDTQPNQEHDDQLLIEAYDEMRKIARRRVLQFGVQSIQGTDLVNETYLRLVGQGRTWQDRRHLFFLAARAMRDIRVDRPASKHPTISRAVIEAS